MGFLDGLFGTKGKLKGAAPDRLFAMTTANITLETGLGLTSNERAGVVFQPIATADFKSIVAETQELLAGTGRSIAGLFSTHPPMEKRIAALQRLEMQLQGTAAAA